MGISRGNTGLSEICPKSVETCPKSCAKYYFWEPLTYGAPTLSLTPSLASYRDLAGTWQPKKRFSSTNFQNRIWQVCGSLRNVAQVLIFRTEGVIYDHYLKRVSHRVLWQDLTTFVGTACLDAVMGKKAAAPKKNTAPVVAPRIILVCLCV